MNVENLRKTSQTLLSFLEENGYSKHRLDRFATEIRNVILDGSDGSIHSYEELAQKWIGKYASISLLSKICLLWAIRDYDLYGKFPTVRSYVPIAKRVSNRSSSFQDIIDNFEETAKSKGLKRSSIDVMIRHITTFFEFMSKIGCLKLTDIEEKDVLAFFYDGKKMLRGHQYMYHIKYVLRENGCKTYRDDCMRIISFLPKIKVREKVYPSLTSDEFEKIKQTLADKDNKLSLRDRAIVIVAMYTGLRSCDIANLQVDNVDFNKDKIVISQQKTSEPLSIPLRPVVGNAIIEYALNERPITACRCLFVSKKSNKGLSSHEISCIISGFLLMSGVRVESGLRGSHLFRHHVAMTLLGADVPNPIITGVLGHTSIMSIEPYLGSDMNNLRKCVISIEGFPMGEEVLRL